MDIKRKCTLRERKQAARILAGRQGLEKLNNEIIQTVGNMSDSEILQFLDNEEKNSTAAVEVLQPGSVEEIRPGGGFDYEKIYNTLVDVANNYIMSCGWDAEKISPLQWGSVCLQVGLFVRSRSLFRGADNVTPNNKERSIDINAVAGAVGPWLSLCYKYNKAPLICNFCDFVNVTESWMLSGVNPGSIDLHKKLSRIQADGLRQRAINPKESPIGAIFLLKADHGLQETQKVTHEYIKNDGSAAALPVFGADLDGLPEKPIK